MKKMIVNRPFMQSAKEKKSNITVMLLTNRTMSWPLDNILDDGAGTCAAGAARCCAGAGAPNRLSKSFRPPAAAAATGLVAAAVAAALGLAADDEVEPKSKSKPADDDDDDDEVLEAGAEAETPADGRVGPPPRFKKSKSSDKQKSKFRSFTQK
jgi:hypothetical protein